MLRDRLLSGRDVLRDLGTLLWTFAKRGREAEKWRRRWR